MGSGNNPKRLNKRQDRAFNEGRLAFRMGFDIGNGAILLIEQTALKKLRNRARFLKDRVLLELAESLMGRVA